MPFSSVPSALYIWYSQRHRIGGTAMTANPRPISITILAAIYIAVGIMGFTYHFREIIALQHDSLWVALIEALAIVCGVFMFLGHNWARWLALAWIAFH